VTGRLILFAELVSRVINKFHVASGVCGLKCANGVQGIYACSVVAVMAGMTCIKEYVFDGQSFWIKCIFEKFEKKSVFFATNSKKLESNPYTLFEDGGFNEWFYLVVPTDFRVATNNTCHVFLNSIRTQFEAHSMHEGSFYVCTMSINVNHVLQGSNAGGHIIQRNTPFTLKFRRPV
jgi:hypothetical protein